MQQQQQHLETSLHKHNWENFNIDTIIGGNSPYGVSFLKLFLQDYINVFGGVASAQCSKCISNYLENYKNHLIKIKMEKNTCQYKLKEKFNNLTLNFGSTFLVNNNNITDSYAEKIIKNYKTAYPDFLPSNIFEIYPNEKQVLEETNVKTNNSEVLEAKELTQLDSKKIKIKKTRAKRNK